MKQLHLSIILLLGFCFSSFSFASLVGKTGGQFSASNGAATYSVPLVLPQGINKLTPQLGISYNSQGASAGYLGVGWVLTGLSAINRCPSTLASEGYTRQLMLDNGDQLCLDGAKLIQRFGGTYRTQTDSYQKIERIGSHFVVYKKSGEIFEYGNSVDSFVEAQGKSVALAWKVNKITDRFGNTIRFHYDERTEYSESVISKIVYNVGPKTEAEVRFSYENLNAALLSTSDASRIGGSLISISKLLTKIEFRLDGEEIRSYTPTYEHRHADKLFPLITQVQECVKGECLSPIRFTWDKQKELSGSEEVHAGVRSLHLQHPHRASGRTNVSRTARCNGYYGNAGNCNRVYTYKTGIYVNNELLGTHNGIVSAYYLDLNIDGLIDYVVWKGDNRPRYDMYINQGDNQFKKIQHVMLADHNGDGAVDKIFLKYAGRFSKFFVEPFKVKGDLITQFQVGDDPATIVEYMDGYLDDAYVKETNPPANHTAITHPGFWLRK